ncbi:acyl-CoA thioesterase [Salegentibacter salarius]|uniref:Thioesterase n=1 Tax=Salegentibacter salarius TaxID=435906 RepID=A0A2N0TYY2_9FLAO|nr:acyl-CoA thioesterase [Salegentibacter salarius]OEY73055.1 thioesterase [Salegentibacter salarius]PKD19954.1 thioesterase [Salegentibacter salarius]SLJ87463.1 acyl-CoA thioester hydrolase [Salegentibacter salarius]
MEPETYKLELQLRIDWSDLDMYKHVNNISFMRYMQSGRVNFWEASGIYEMYENSNMGTMLVSTHCDFKKSLYYPGKAIVKTKLDFIKNSSFGLKHLILDEANEICAEGKDVVVCYDFDKDKTFRIPEDLREKLSEF